MKKKWTLSLCLVLVAAAFFLACQNPAAGEDYTPPGADIQGTFSYQGKNIIFKVSDSGSRAIRASASDGYTVEGKLKHDNSVITVKGTYIPEAKYFSISAGRDGFVYTINGSLDDNYRLKSATAILQIRVGASWTTAEEAVNPATNVSIPEDAAPMAGALPSVFWGKWISADTEETMDQIRDQGFTITDVNVFVIFSPYSVFEHVYYEYSYPYFDEDFSFTFDYEGVYNVVAVEEKTSNESEVQLRLKDEFLGGYLEERFTFTKNGNNLRITSLLNGRSLNYKR
jgi:hypothetical protein